VLSGFHATADTFGQVMDRHWNLAYQGALLSAKVNNIEFDMEACEEAVANGVGRELVSTLHGDSDHSQWISGVATTSVPTTFTYLPQNGNIFNTANIPTSSSNNRASNNRLGSNRTGPGKGNVRPGESRVLFPVGVNPTATTTPALPGD